MPTDELIGVPSGLNAWAATPAKSARVAAPENRRAKTEAGVAAGSPKRSSAQRVARADAAPGA